MGFRVDQGHTGPRRARGRRGRVSQGVTAVVVVALGVLWACVPRGPVVSAPAAPVAPQGFVASAVARPVAVPAPRAQPTTVGEELDRELKASLRAPAPAARPEAPAAPLFRISARHELSATMYCLKGRTRTGIRTRDGVAAADPEFLPLGSVVRLSRDGRPLGVFVVMDTGGAVKGRKIDIYVDDCAEATRWGRRQVTAEVLDLGRDAV